MTMQTGQARSVLITGANGGIGTALCERFRQNGYYVVATDVQPAAQCNCDEYLRLDLARYLGDESQRSFLRQAIADIDKTNPLHCLVNNAALQTLGEINSLTAANALDTFNVNVFAAIA